MRVSITTLGCKVNQYESQALETLLRERGHSISAPGETAHACILNTCAVTAESGRKSRKAIRRARQEHPGAVVAVCGCFSQISPGEISGLGADLVYGSGERAEFLEDLERVCNEHTGLKKISDPMKRHRFEVLPSGGLSGRTRAFLKIQDGCDNFCAYCIIPYARGPARSMPPETAVAEAGLLAERGYREIVITGIEISSYGKESGYETDLTKLTGQICARNPGVRIRLGSLEPCTVTEDFCRSMASLSGVCRHFHLSLQSGCDETLKRMGRKYDTGQFYEALRRLREYVPGCSVTTDLIVGFPGETDSEFEKTLEFIRACDFSAMHIFPYSIRPGTAAAVMEGQLDKKTRTARARSAGEVAGEMKRAYLDSCVGKVLEVLFETEEDGVGRGHADNYCQVEIKGHNLKNQLVPVLITGVSDEILVGESASSV